MPKKKSKPKRSKKQSSVKKNKSVGSQFETKVLKFLTKVMKDNKIRGTAYKFPNGKHCDQKIDILVDSNRLGFIGVECKSISEANHGHKIYFSNICNTNAKGETQIDRQHVFLKNSCRYGIVAFEFRNMDRAFLVPHKFIFDKIRNGYKFVTMEEVINNGYMIGSDGDFEKFVKNKCG